MQDKKNYAVSKQCASNIYFLFHHVSAYAFLEQQYNTSFLCIKCTHEREERKKFGFCRFWFRQKELQNKATAVTQ